MYVYETGEMRKILSVENGQLEFMIVARENDFIVSCHTLDNYWATRNKINGTYKYDISTNELTKLSDKMYCYLSQFSDNYFIYGSTGRYNIFDLKRIVKSNNL